MLRAQEHPFVPGDAVLASHFSTSPVAAPSAARLARRYCPGVRGRAIALWGRSEGKGRVKDSDSFDPRRWGASPAAPPAPGELSFDPRSWAAPAKPAMPVAPARGRNDGRAPLAAAASLAILAAGALAAWSARPPAPVARRPSVVAAPMAVDIAPTRRVLTVASPAEIAPSLIAAGVVAIDAHAVGARATVALGKAAGDVRLVFDMTGVAPRARLNFAEATHPDGSGLALTRSGEAFTAQSYAAALTERLVVVRGKLDAQSFYSSAVAAGVNDTLIAEFANAFSFDFDLQREVKPGDGLEAGYEQRFNAGGETVGAPVLVYASLATPAKARALYRFTRPGDKAPGWFDAAGRSTRRALMRTPIDGARITSPFGMREHPILGFMKMHKGTDFAAPTGTPIFAAGDATVEFAGPKGPNGNFVKLRHDNGWETLYLHMNRIWPTVATGARVSQGQQIGEVGTTGRSTGPHLHYEVHVSGEPVDPLGIDTGSGVALNGSALAAFKQARAKVDAARGETG